jgi:carboxylesterase
MDGAQTAPFELGEGREACLLLHGFTGSPWEMRPLGEALAARGYHVRCPLLPGHGATPEALLHVGERDWLEAAEAEAARALAGHRRLYVAGLSVGALLALLLAARRPGDIHGLALLAPALRLRGAGARLARPLAGLGLLGPLFPWVQKTGSDIEDPDARARAPLLVRWPSERLRDVFSLQAQARAALPRVRAATLVAVAERDHVVDPREGRRLARGLVAAPRVHVLHLRAGFHILPRDRAGPRLACAVGDFFDRLRVEGLPGASGESGPGTRPGPPLP